MTSGPSPDGADGQRTLRILIAAPISLLMLTIAVLSLLAGQLNGSISSYYGGPARDVFVGSMLATALGIVAFRGSSDLEDLALSGAGFYAPFVAFVPFDFASRPPAATSPGAADPATYLKIIVICYLVAALTVGALVHRSEPRPVHRLLRGSIPSRVLVFLALLLLVAYVALVVVRLVEPHSRFAGVHLIGAVLLIVSLGFAVLSHVVPDRHRGGVGEPTAESGPGVRAVYWALVAGMAVGGPLLLLVLRTAQVHSALLWTETLELVLFGVFWGVELLRDRRAPDRLTRRAQSWSPPAS